MDTFEELWQSVLDYCKQRINETAFTLWLLPIEIGDFNNGKVVLKFSNSFKKNTVVGQYGELLNEAFEAVCGFPVEIEYTSPEDFLTESEKNQQDLEDFKNETFTFDNFIVGPSNKFAYTAAKAIAADPGGQISKGNNLSNYNPLFIYGNSGLGKTHILNAISYEVRRNYPDMKVVYVTCEEFLNEFLANMYKKNNEEFRNKYRNIDVFLVDDIQFIAGKDSTEEEFFHTFNALVDNGKQVVLTADRPPKEIKSLTDRLASRFVSGLLADIQTPEYDTRCAIIKRKAELLNFEIDDNVIQYIAGQIKSNIRQLEGVVKKLKAKILLSGEEPSLSVVKEGISDILNDDTPPELTVEKIIEEVARNYGFSPDEIKKSKSRRADLSQARHIAIYIARNITNLTAVEVGKEFGGMHYSSVLYATEHIEKDMKTNNDIKESVEDIIKNIRDR